MSSTFRPGMTAQDREGNRVGTVEDVLYDADGMAKHLVVRDRGFFSSDVVLPVDAASASGDAVRFALSKDQIRAGERFDPVRFGERAGLTSAAATAYHRKDDQ